MDPSESKEFAGEFASHFRVYRLWDLAMWARRHRLPLVPQLLRRRIRSRFGADLPLWDRRPPELFLMHNALGVVIHPDVVFLGKAVIFQHVTIGDDWLPHSPAGVPVIGDGCVIGAGALIVGAVSVPAGTRIGGNATVTYRQFPQGPRD